MSERSPIRTCIGCGERVPQDVLVRVTATPDGLRVDGARRAAGRGAYLHRSPACWGAFVRRRRPVRSFRVNPPREVRERLVTALAAVVQDERREVAP